VQNITATETGGIHLAQCTVSNLWIQCFYVCCKVQVQNKTVLQQHRKIIHYTVSL